MKQFPKASSGFSLGGGAAPAAADDDDDVDLFGSRSVGSEDRSGFFSTFIFSDEEESEEKKRITEERLKAYHEKKSKKAAVIAKTSVLLDVKVGFNFFMSGLFSTCLEYISPTIHVVCVCSPGMTRLTWTRC